MGGGGGGQVGGGGGSGGWGGDEAENTSNKDRKEANVTDSVLVQFLFIYLEAF